MLAPDWAKNACVIVPSRQLASPEFFSCVPTRRLLSRILVRFDSFIEVMRAIRKGNFNFLISYIETKELSMTRENISDAISGTIPICTEKILSLTDHKVS